MKTIGIVGGIGPESTVDYYRQLLKRAPELGARSAPVIVINSVDFQRMYDLVAAGDPEALAGAFAEEVRVLERAGAAVGLLAANTPHMVFDAIQAQVSLPLVSIVAATAEEAAARGLRRLGLLGTRFTMRGTFFGEVFAARGMTIVAPEGPDLDYVHHKYVNELVPGRFLDETRQGLAAVMKRLGETVRRGRRDPRRRGTAAHPARRGVPAAAARYDPHPRRRRAAGRPRVLVAAGLQACRQRARDRLLNRERLPDPIQSP